jgi:histidinol-phosphate aminotransferase
VPEPTTLTTPAPRSRVLEMKEYHPPLGSRNALRLDFNENTLECSPRVLQALARIAAQDLTRYPERESVEAKVASYLKLTPAQTVLTNGVDEAIHVLCETFLDRGDELLLPVPTYTMYEVYASSTDASLRSVQAGEDFAFPYERLLTAITPKTKLIAIANPNSPTGSIATREQIVEIAMRAPQAIVLIDEAYFHFYGESIADLIGTIPNLMLARTFSKAYGLAGLRIGVLAGSEEVMRWIRRVLSPYSVNSLALACLTAALQDEAYLNWYIDQVSVARTEFKVALQERGVRFWPTHANFVLVFIGEKHREFTEAMRQKGVLVRDRSADPGCDGCVRITIGTREQMLVAQEALTTSLAAIGWENKH